MHSFLTNSAIYFVSIMERSEFESITVSKKVDRPKEWMARKASWPEDTWILLLGPGVPNAQQCTSMNWLQEFFTCLKPFLENFSWMLSQLFKASTLSKQVTVLIILVSVTRVMKNRTKSEWFYYCILVFYSIKLDIETSSMHHLISFFIPSKMKGHTIVGCFWTFLVAPLP